MMGTKHRLVRCRGVGHLATGEEYVMVRCDHMAHRLYNGHWFHSKNAVASFGYHSLSLVTPGQCPQRHLHPKLPDDRCMLCSYRLLRDYGLSIESGTFTAVANALDWTILNGINTKIETVL